MRAIIPVAGIGTRLRPHTHTAPKVLLHVAGKPILGHILDDLKDYGITELALIVGYRGDQVREYVSSNYSFKTSYIVQEEMLGLGHAIWMARNEGWGAEPGLIILGDTIFSADLKTVMARGRSALGVKWVEDARRFGVVQHTPEGRITKLVEKAEVPPSNLALCGIYFINDMPLLFDRLQHLMDNNLRTRGEFQLTDGLQGMIEKGHDMTFFEIDGWYDCGKRETMLSTNKALLDMKSSLLARPDSPNIVNCVLRQPVVIDPTARVENSIIGPYASISSGCVVRHSIISESIMSTNATVEDIVLHDSIISDNASVRGLSQMLNVGDASEINFSE